jgi:hypothetical protein
LGCHVEEGKGGGLGTAWHEGGRWGSGRQQDPGMAEAGVGRAMHEQGRRGFSQVDPAWKREGAHGPRLENVGRPRRNSVIFY